MANAKYDKGREKFCTGNIDWMSDTIKAVMIDVAAYTVNISAHEFLSSVPSGARVGTPVALTNKSVTAGACNADPTVFSTVSGPSIEAVIIYKDTGDEATSPLLAYMDTGTGLPITPNSGDITLTWDTGANKIFRM